MSTFQIHKKPLSRLAKNTTFIMNLKLSSQNIMFKRDTKQHWKNILTYYFRLALILNSLYKSFKFSENCFYCWLFILFHMAAKTSGLKDPTVGEIDHLMVTQINENQRPSPSIRWPSRGPFARLDLLKYWLTTVLFHIRCYYRNSKSWGPRRQ